MCRHHSGRLALLTLLLFASAAAFADLPGNYTWVQESGNVTASTVDFDTWMLHVSQFTYGGDYVFGLVAPATADNNRNFILDATEFAVITAICNNINHPLHTQVHEAYKKNLARLGGDNTVSPIIKPDLGSISIALCNPIRFVMAAYATLGDGSYTASGSGSTRKLDEFEGSWGIVAAVIEGAKTAGGSLWSTGAPIEANYERLQLPTPLISACADTDGDGLCNANEYFGQSMNRANYVLAVLDSAMVVCGAGPGACAGNSTCLVPNVHYVFDAPNGKVYLLTPTTMTWNDAETYAQSLTIGGISIPSHLASINSAAENALCRTLAVANDDNLWIGGSDAAVEDEWRWVETGVEFYHGKAASGGAAVGGAYVNWNDGEPNGDSEDACELKTNGTWNDNNAASLRKGLIEVAGTFADANTNGIPDSFESQLCGPYGCVGQKPKANFSWTPSSALTRDPVQFTDTSTGSGITTWAWNFGDTASGGANTSSLQNPTHTFQAAGTYAVSLTVTNENGPDTTTKDVVVAVNPNTFGFASAPHGAWYQEGARIELNVVVARQVGTVTYQWKKDGADIPNATVSSLVIDPAAIEDTGWYSCQATDTSKAVDVIQTAPVLISVFAAGALPLVGGVGLAMAILSCVGAGVTAIRRRRSR